MELWVENADTASLLNETHIKHLLPHRGRVRRALIGKQPFGNCAGR